jgi:hypothetical protein
MPLRDRPDRPQHQAPLFEECQRSIGDQPPNGDFFLAFSKSLSDDQVTAMLAWLRRCRWPFQWADAAGYEAQPCWSQTR